jgi:predicted nucleic acid-binding protein
MKRFVLDCSVSAAWCLKDEASREADRILDLLARGEALVPALWVVEMANVFVTAQRRKRISREDARLASELLGQLPIVIDAQGTQSMQALQDLAVECGIAAYDASYLEMARRFRLPLASLDRGQRAAAETADVRLL